MKIDVLTLFPAMFAGPLDESIIKRAREAGPAGFGNPQLARLTRTIATKRLMTGHLAADRACC